MQEAGKCVLGGDAPWVAANSWDWVPIFGGIREDSGPGQIERDRN